jgi:WD40 repeat protein
MSDEISKNDVVDDGRVPSYPSTSFTYTGQSDNVFCIAFAPDGARMASASRDTTVRVWRVPGGEDLLVYREHGASLLSVAWSPNGGLIASGDTSGVVKVWSASSGETTTTYRGHTRFARCIGWSPDGRLIVSGGDYGDSTAQVWEASTGTLVCRYTRQYRLFAVGWQPVSRGNGESRRIVSCSFTLRHGLRMEG